MPNKMTADEMSPEFGLLRLRFKTEALSKQDELWRECWRNELLKEMYFLEHRLERLKNLCEES